MNTRQVVEWIRRGKWVTVEFVKRTTGELRTMLCRYGVKQHVTGQGRAYTDDSVGVITVWDRTKGEYRTIPIEGIVRVKVRGQWVEVTKDNGGGDGPTSANAVPPVIGATA